MTFSKSLCFTYTFFIYLLFSPYYYLINNIIRFIDGLNKISNGLGILSVECSMSLQINLYMQEWIYRKLTWVSPVYSVNSSVQQTAGSLLSPAGQSY